MIDHLKLVDKQAEKTRHYSIQNFFDEDGKLHRDHGPAVVYKSIGNDEISRVDYYEHGNYVRSVKFFKGSVSKKTFNSGPLIKIKYKNNENVKEAVYIYSNGNTFTEKIVSHGKAKIKSYKHNGSKISENHYLKGSRHNLNGPAKIEYDKQGNQINKEYYVKGRKLDELAFLVKASIERANEEGTL